MKVDDTKRYRVREAETTGWSTRMSLDRMHILLCTGLIHCQWLLQGQSARFPKKEKAAVHASATATFSRAAISIAWALSVFVEDEQLNMEIYMLDCLEMHEEEHGMHMKWMH